MESDDSELVGGLYGLLEGLCSQVLYVGRAKRGVDGEGEGEESKEEGCPAVHRDGRECTSAQSGSSELWSTASEE